MKEIIIPMIEPIVTVLATALVAAITRFIEKKKIEKRFSIEKESLIRMLEKARNGSTPESEKNH